MAKKRYHINTACPQCGCTELTTMSEEQIKKKYGDMPNIHMECSECMRTYAAPMKEACPDWDEACKMEPS